MDHFEIRWTAPEFEYHEKDVSWFWISIIIAILMIAFAVWNRNFLFAFLIVLAEILFIVWGGRKPANFDFLLNEKGLRIGDTHHPFSEMEKFSVFSMDGSDWTELVLYMKKRLINRITVFMPAAYTDHVVQTLSGFIPKVEHEESFLDSLARFLRF